MKYNPWRTSSLFLLLVISFFCGWTGNIKPLSYNPHLSIKAAFILIVIVFLVSLIDTLPKFLSKQDKSDELNKVKKIKISKEDY